VQPGLCASVELVVGEGDTAIAFGSGDVPVLGTPRVVALCEEACVVAVAGQLGEGQTTVGVRVELDHLRASAVGAHVAATATLTQVDGSRLSFAVGVVEGEREVARGLVVRTVVDRDGFLARLG